MRTAGSKPAGAKHYAKMLGATHTHAWNTALSMLCATDIPAAIGTAVYAASRMTDSDLGRWRPDQAAIWIADDTAVSKAWCVQIVKHGV